jgi:hypothetical protein
VNRAQPARVETEVLKPRLGGRAQLFLQKHGKKLWWLHSLYALVLGSFVVLFAQKGFAHARMLAITLGAAWLLLIAMFRLGAARAIHEKELTSKKVRFFVMSYVLKNLYQGMLFFLLPFYWKATTFGAKNEWFVLLLGACAVLSTLDIVFDRFLMRWSWVASLFHGLTLFSCMNLVVPALFPNTRTLYSLMWAAAAAMVGFWTIHLRLGLLRDKRYIGLLIASMIGAVSAAYFARRAIPPVPMYMSSGAVGPSLLPDGRLAMEVTNLHTSVIREIYAVTDVVVPGGKGDRLLHVWRHDGRDLDRAPETVSRVRGPFGAVRLRSTLTAPELPEKLVGPWCVDVETEDGQLVGRVSFTVVD